MDNTPNADAGSAGIDPAQVQLVQSSFQHVLPITDVAGQRILPRLPEKRRIR